MTTRMTTPTKMTTSMITTVTTMMTDVVVVPSLGGLLVGCVLLLTGAVLIMLLRGRTVIGGTVLVMAIVPTVGEEVISAKVVDKKHTQYIKWKETQVTDI